MRTIVLLALSFAGACVHELPPAATPERVVPAGIELPPADGTGHLVIDVVDGPTPVQRVSMEAQPFEDEAGRQTWRFSESMSLMCPRSPCIANVGTGNVLLAFPVVGDSEALEVELVHVGDQTTVYRRALSHYDGGSGTYVPSIVGASLGGMTMVPGLVFLPLGLAKGNDGFTAAGAITLGVGSVLLGLSILGIVYDAPQHQSGASTHFPITTEPVSASD